MWDQGLDTRFCGNDELSPAEGVSLRFVFTAPRYHTNQHFAVKALLDAGHEVSFLALGRGQSEFYEAIQPIVLGEAGVVRLWRRVWRQMRALRPDVVVVRNPLTAFGLVSIAAARLTGSAVVLYSHTPMHMRFRWWQKLKGWAVTWISRAAWTTPVLGQPDRHPPGLGAMRYVPFVIEPQTAPERREWFRDGAVNVLCIGKFQARKNHRLFLEAVSRLSGRYPVRATIVGECTNAEHRRELAGVEELRASLGLADRVVVKTNLPFPDVQQEYARHDLFVLPARREAASVSVLEAMAHSLPVICSDSNGTQCYIRPGENGLVFASDDVDGLTAAMGEIVEDRERLKAMGRRSYELVVSEHAPERYVRALEELVGARLRR